MTTIVHIGSSKAASTSIQMKFQNLKDDFFYFGKNIDIEKFKEKGVGDIYLDEDCRALTKLLVDLDRYTGIDPQLKQNIQKKVKLAESNNKIFFYSCEMLCESASIYHVIKILREIFPNDLKILYIVRNQFETINSLYNYQGHKSAWLKSENYKYVSFEDFFVTAYKNNEINMGHKSNYWLHDFIRIYNFNEIIEIINKAAPDIDILVFPLEELQKKKDLNLITKFLEKKLNKKFSIKNTNNQEIKLNLEKINQSNNKEFFFKVYSILSYLRINPHNLNKKIKKFFDYKIIFKFFKNRKVDKKYFYIIKELYLEDNLKLIRKFESLKDYEAKYKFEE